MLKLSKLLFIFFMLTSFANAIENYAVVDVQKILQSSKAFESFQKQAQKLKEELEKDFTKESDSLKAIETDLTQNRNNYSPVEFEKKRKDFETKVANFKEKVQKKQQSFDKNSAEILKSIEQEMQKIVSKIVSEEKYDIIFQAMGLAYYPKNKDISDKVLEKLNSSLSSVTLKKP